MPVLRPKLDEAVKDLNAFLPQLASDYALPPSTHWTLHLTTQEAVARQVMLRDLKANQNQINTFFASNSSVISSGNGPAGIASLIFMPDTTYVRGGLAFDAGSYYMSALGGGIPSSGVYPYWFSRGFVLYVHTRYSESGFSVRQSAINDAQAGTAPSLARISNPADVFAAEAAAANNAVQVDARGEAAFEYIARKYGEAALGRLLRDNSFGNIPKFNDLLQEITKMGIDDFNATVTASLH